MADATERLLLRLEWTVLRRLEGRVQGGHRTAHRGLGTDFTGLRTYAEGDDARRIDWNVTARTTEPHVRLFTEDRDLTVWLVVDRSASMATGPRDRDKGAVAAELATVLARLFERRGDRVAAVLYGAGAPRVVPPGTGRRQVLRIAAELQRLPASDRSTTDLAAMLDAAGRLARRPALVVVVSDFIGSGEVGHALGRLAVRHEVAAVRIADAGDDALPDAGLLVVEDAETGEQLLVDTGDPLFRRRFAEGVADRDAALDGAARRAGVLLHRIGTEDDPAEALVGLVTSTAGRAR